MGYVHNMDMLFCEQFLQFYIQKKVLFPNLLSLEHSDFFEFFQIFCCGLTLSNPCINQKLPFRIWAYILNQSDHLWRS
jgi:hypothetical protein